MIDMIWFGLTMLLGIVAVLQICLIDKLRREARKDERRKDNR